MPDDLTTHDNRTLDPSLISELRRKARRRGAINHRTHNGIYISLHLYMADWTVVVYTLTGPPTNTVLQTIQAALNGQPASWIISGPVAVLHCRA